MLYLIIGIIILCVVLYIFAFNALVKFKNWMEESWSQIDVQLLRRNDLIPNLVETVKGYAKYEKETLESVIKMRNQLAEGNFTNRSDEMEISNQLTNSLKSIFALAESYPDLKANQNYLQLQHELVNTENKIAYSRQLYNNTVMKYNIKVESFPSSIIAKIHSFNKSSMLETAEDAKVVPNIKL